jgi:hypothetical protein
LKGKRKRGSKTQKDRVIIIHGPNQKTEHNYFKAFLKAMGDKRNCSVIPTIKSMKSNTCDPVALVKEAIKYMNDNKNKDVGSCWVLGDRDQNFDLQKAINIAKKFEKTVGGKQKINVIWSNQAFEIWFIYHFQRIPGYIHRNKYAKKINNFFRNNNISANYTKSDEKHFEYLKEFISTAVDNADFSYQSHIIKQGKNPNNACSCTNVFELVKRLNLISQNKMF